MDAGIGMDARKDGLLWAILARGPAGVGGRPYEHVLIDPSIREATTKEAVFYGKKRIEGGWKLTLSGTVDLLTHTWGSIGPLSEELVIVRGTAKTTVDGRNILANAESFNIIHIHPVKNDGLVQEYWVFINKETGGNSSGL